MSHGCVYLVGAGCGAADLITMRGFALLRRCQVLVYDDLIDEELLDAVPADAERIYMGKRNGRPSAAQGEICDVLKDRARMGKMVVRLKGGDPFVFGRGGEEALALREAGIPFEVVPGITSAIAIPSEAGIPVTHRGLSRSVHIITAHTADADEGLPEYFDQLAKLPGTLVFLMGLSRLEAIAQGLMKAGMRADVPAAVLSGGNAPRRACVRGTLGDISARVRAAEVCPPAVIVVGGTAAMDLAPDAQAASWGSICVGLTGTDALAERIRAGLNLPGVRCFRTERSIVQEFEFGDALDGLCDGARHWIVLTSENGVRIFFKKLRERGLDLRKFNNCRFAVIGRRTAQVLQACGIRADFCPSVYTAEALARELPEAIGEEGDVYLFRSAQASAQLRQALAERFRVREISTYDICADAKVASRARNRLEEMDYLTFGSESGVRLYFETQGGVPDRTRCICIGEVTARALKRYYAKPFLTAAEISADGIVQAIIRGAQGT